MHATHTRRRIQTRGTKTTGFDFFNLLTSPELLDSVDNLSPKHRERLYTPTETLSMFLAQVMSADSSCQQAVNQAAIQRLGHGLSSNSTHTGGYCRARQRLPTDMVSELARQLGALIDQQSADPWCWKNRRVLIADGTTLTMPDTEDNQREFPQQRAQKPGLGFPICRLVGITSLASGALLNAAISPYSGKGSDEQTLLRSMADTFESGDLVLGDAFYPTYFFIAAMQAKGVDLLMEQNGARKLSTDFRRGHKLGTCDHLIDLKKPAQCPAWMSAEDYAEAPATLTIREFKHAKKIMVTTLNCPKSHPSKELASLYKERWHIELDIRNIKTTMGMHILSCKSPEMAVKEVWVYLLAYNMIRLMMAQSALLADLSPRQLSFKHCLQLWLVYQQCGATFDANQLTVLFKLMAQQRVGLRPNRAEPRAVKRRPKPYPLLTKPRDQARADVRKFGHAKKLK